MRGACGFASTIYLAWISLHIITLVNTWNPFHHVVSIQNDLSAGLSCAVQVSFYAPRFGVHFSWVDAACTASNDALTDRAVLEPRTSNTIFNNVPTVLHKHGQSVYLFLPTSLSSNDAEDMGRSRGAFSLRVRVGVSE